jgi:hypothetical protein
MAWDLRAALLKKQEFETAQLLDFEFRHRIRTMRLMAEQLPLNGNELARRTVLEDDESILDDIVAKTGQAPEDVRALYIESFGAARRQLIQELGDPTPHRLG